VSPKFCSAPASIASVIVTPRNLSRPRSSPSTILGDSPDGRFGSRAGYVAHDVMIMSTLALMAYVKGNSSMLRRSDNDTSSVTDPRCGTNGSGIVLSWRTG
jgi:hypothetical protein